MVKRLVQQGDGGSNPTSSLHFEAEERFKADPNKCYQRHIREVYAEKEPKPSIPSLNGARVVRITNEEAKPIILKFEWITTMGAGTVASYGLKIENELIGVACFGRVGLRIAEICRADTVEETKKLAQKTAYLMRGACVPWAPKDSASFLIRNACRQAHKEFGWRIFFAYSDLEAGEIGTVYQAVGWSYLGAGRGRTGAHYDFLSPDGKELWTSQKINHNREELAKRLGAPLEKGRFRPWLRDHGWTEIRRESSNKGVYVWFEGNASERRELKKLCRYPFLPYPKRADEEIKRRLLDAACETSRKK